MNVNEVLAPELHKPVIVYASFKGNIRVADLAEIRSLSSFTCGLKYLLCVIDVFTKHAWAKSLTNRKTKTVFDTKFFIDIVNESKRKPNELWVDQGVEFYNVLFQ